MQTTNHQPVRIAIIGSGNVGATCAHSLLVRGIASEIALIDSNRARAEGEAMDLNHAVPFTRPTRVWAGDYSDCADAQVIVLAAGTNQRPGETRLDLLQRNAAIFGEIVPQIAAVTRNAILVVATNPVDVLTYVALKSSGFEPSRVLGSGTILDTARFRHLLGRHFGIEPRSVHAYVIGEHGDSEVPVWSLASIAGMRLDDYARLNQSPLDSTAKAQIVQDTRTAAFEIIRRKGATYYGVAAGLTRIIEAITRDENSVLTVSTLVQGEHGLSDVCLSLPCVVNGDGVSRTVRMPLDEAELVGLKQSAEVIRRALATVKA